MAWDGVKRREQDKEDHDLLTQIDTKLTILLDNFDKHLQEDKEIFKVHDGRIKKLEQIMWAGIGIIFVMEIALKIWK